MPNATPEVTYSEALALGRIVAALVVRGMPLARLARETGIPYRSLQNYVAGRVKLTLAATTKIAIALDVSLDWIATGRAAALDPPILRQALDAMEGLPPEQARSLKDRADALASAYQSLYQDVYDVELTGTPDGVTLLPRIRTSRKRSD